jgi:hypothetical protein
MVLVVEGRRRLVMVAGADFHLLALAMATQISSRENRVDPRIRVVLLEEADTKIGIKVTVATVTIERLLVFDRAMAEVRTIRRAVMTEVWINLSSRKQLKQWWRPSRR